ncbi:MAG: YdiU family protein [Candidatus Poseidonia sp.]|nr:YdiU family protein [Poseidonia sp.]
MGEFVHEWGSPFLDQTPGDVEVGGTPRRVPGACWSRTIPASVPLPSMKLWSVDTANQIGIELKDPMIWGGQQQLPGMDCFAQRYGGHQFGNWAGQLGDGRAITLGQRTVKSGWVELQLKGSGITPYSRRGDGKAVLRSSVREFLCSEAMHHLGVPTSRALSLVETGEHVMRDILYNGQPAPEPGAIICRVAPSFLRFGTYQIHVADGQAEALAALVEHTLQTHFPTHHMNDDDGLIAWFRELASTTANMVAQWMRVGFVHGVMNTDNMSVHGITIDYGPYGWLENFDRTWTPNTTDASTRRYRYSQQPAIAGWNLARFLESMVPLMKSPERLQSVLEHYSIEFTRLHTSSWMSKLGLKNWTDSDGELLEELQNLLEEVETDMTIFFRELSHLTAPDITALKAAFYDPNQIPFGWKSWLERWWERCDSTPDRDAMLQANPKYVLRNWMAQMAIEKAEKGDYSLCEELHQLLKHPYDEQPGHETAWYAKRPEWARDKVGCSMLSCSS